MSDLLSEHAPSVPTRIRESSVFTSQVPWADDLLWPLRDALKIHLSPDEGLLDPDCTSPTPDDHYGQTATALALLLLDGAENDSWRIPLRVWSHLPTQQIGHLPFNRLLLLLIRDTLAWRVNRTSSNRDGDKHIDDGLHRCRLAWHYPSNNWSLLAQTCRLIEAKPRSRRAQLKRFCAQIDRWTTSDGAFIDYPVRPRSIGATPMTYHHKALFLAAVAAHWCDDSILEPRIQRLLDWLPVCWDGDDGIAGFGRSSQALFADACLLAALTLLRFPVDGDGLAASITLGIQRRLSRQRRADGFYALNPASLAGGQRGWDPYMALTVYNAWFAAILAWSLRYSAKTDAPQYLASLTLNESSCLYGRQARGRNRLKDSLTKNSSGILKIESKGGLTLLFSACGQPPQAFSRTTAEFRYSGGFPFTAKLGERSLIPPPARVAADQLRANPAHAGWTPVFLIGNNLYGLTDYSLVDFEQSDNQTRILLRGYPTALLRHSPTRSFARLIAALDWRLFGGMLGQQAALDREHIATIEADMEFIVAHTQPLIHVKFGIKNRSDVTIRYLNPAGHSFIATDPPSARRIELNSQVGAKSRHHRETTTDGLLTAEMDCSVAHARAACWPVFELSPGSETCVALSLKWSAKESDTRPESFQDSALSTSSCLDGQDHGIRREHMPNPT